MASVLVVKGHPLTAEESRTVKALTSFLTSYKENHPDDEVTVLELYRDDIQKSMKNYYQVGRHYVLVQNSLPYQKVNNKKSLVSMN